MPGVCKFGWAHWGDWIEVQQDDVKSLIDDMRAWIDANPGATNWQIKQALKTAIENRWPAAFTKPRYWLLLGLLDAGGIYMTEGEIKWLVRTFWDDIPQPLRRGPKP